MSLSSEAAEAPVYAPYEKIAYGPLDPEVSLEPDFFTDFVPERRAQIVAQEAAFYHQLTEPYSVDDLLKKDWLNFSSYDGTPLKVKRYRPCASGDKPLLPLLFFHGGGWKTCSVETHDYVPSYLAAKAGVCCLSVEYRLAPEHQLPVGLEDCYAACLWAARNADELGIDAGHMVVAGDSSGGNFAAVIAQLARERGDLHLAGQVLVYPVCDLEDLVEGKRSPGVYGPLRGMQTGPSALSREYLPDPEDQIRDPRFAPLLSPDVNGLPDVLFILAECDSLVDDGLFYAKRLSDAGVNVEVHVYSGMPHAFILRTYAKTFDALDAIVLWLKKREVVSSAGAS